MGYLIIVLFYDLATRRGRLVFPPTPKCDCEPGVIIPPSLLVWRRVKTSPNKDNGASPYLVRRNTLIERITRRETRVPNCLCGKVDHAWTLSTTDTPLSRFFCLRDKGNGGLASFLVR